MSSGKTPALFLDRDGVINVDRGYVHCIEDFVFVAGIFGLCRTARSLGYKLVVVTNQAGIGRGLYTEDDFHRLTVWMRERFEEEGAPIDAVYFCPTHPTAATGRYRVESEMRKPRPGMLFKAAGELGIDLTRSVLIGDKPSDMAAALGAGVPVRLLLNDGRDTASSESADATHWIESLAKGVAVLVTIGR